MTNSSRIIIIDGPDMCGKTQIATEIARRFGYHYFKNSHERVEFGKDSDYFAKTLKYGLTYFIDFLAQTDVKVIFDRCHPSEFVYSRIFERATDEQSLEWCDSALARTGASVIIPFRTDYASVVDDSHPELVHSATLKKLHEMYVQFTLWTKIPTFWLNVDDENLEREIRDVALVLGLGT